MALTAGLEAGFGDCPVPHRNSYWLKTAISSADLEVLDTLLISANKSGTCQKSRNELLTFLEYVNSCPLAKEEGREHYKRASFVAVLPSPAFN